MSHEGNEIVRIGAASAALRPGRHEIEVLLDADGTDEDRAAALAHALEHVGDAEHSVWVDEPGGHFDAIAERHGLEQVRDLLQLRCELPIEERTDLATRPFRPGEDDDAFLRVNNRAFAWHREQGHLSAGDMVARIAEPWFDAAGFLLHDGDDGKIDGFCWTKVHRDCDPHMGEIYAIATDPDAQGRGLGRALVVAGLTYLAARGLVVGMLYVDADNGPARRLYDKLGFVIAHRRRLYLPSHRPLPR